MSNTDVTNPDLVDVADESSVDPLSVDQPILSFRKSS